jgi:hypothetical protein
MVLITIGGIARSQTAGFKYRDIKAKKQKKKHLKVLVNNPVLSYNLITGKKE